MATRQKRLDAGREFFRRLGREEPWAPIFVLTGEEQFLVGMAIDRLVQRIFPDGPDEFNWMTHRASERKGPDVVADADTLPMFAQRRALLVRGAEAWQAADWQAIATYAENPNPSTLLLIEARSLDLRSKAARSLQKAAGVELVDFPPLYEREVEPWLLRRAELRGLRLSRDVPSWLVEAIGTDLHALDSAMERLELYLADNEEKRVSLDLCAEVLADTRVRSVFDLVDALAARDLDGALSGLSRMLLHGESPIGMVHMIARQFRMLLLARAARAEGLSGPALAKAAGCPPFRVRELEQAARRFSDQELALILGEVARCDQALKSSRLPDRVHLESLLIRICRNRIAA